MSEVLRYKVLAKVARHEAKHGEGIRLGDLASRCRYLGLTSAEVEDIVIDLCADEVVYVTGTRPGAIGRPGAVVRYAYLTDYAARDKVEG